MIEWGFRFQRPQQLMRQFARNGHLVLYAANQFHRGVAARTRSVATNIVEITLPGDPVANIYQSLPSEPDRDRMVEAMDRLRVGMGVDDAVIVAQHPYWTALSESLARRFGWPIVYDCMDDHSGFLHNSSDILRTESWLVATADLVLASSSLLFEGSVTVPGPRSCSAMRASMTIFISPLIRGRASRRPCGSATTGRSPSGSTVGWSRSWPGFAPTGGSS